MRGAPLPRLGDPDLDDLLQLASRLSAELPRDLPDPAFRANLGAELSRGAHTRPRSIATAPTRFPYLVAVSAIAAVLVAAIAVGSLAIWTQRDDEGNLARRTTGVAQATSAALTPTLTSAAFGASNTTPSAAITTMLATVPPDATQAPPVPTTAHTAVPTTATAVSTATAPAPAQTSTPSSDRTATASLAVADPPQVDRSSIEMGPQPAVDGGGGEAGSNLTVEVNTAVPDLGATATVYYLATPAEDLTALTTRVAHSLGIDGDVAESQSANGRHLELHVDNANGHFALTPDTGAFTFATTGAGAGDDAGLTPESATQKALDWLSSVGYPVDQLGQPVVDAPGDSGGEWHVQIGTDSVPGITLGHSAGVELWIASDGRISSGDGYWLIVEHQNSATLISANEAIDALKAGEGYWGGGGAAAGGGSFRIDALSLGYVLTSDGRGKLIAQPVVVATGQFSTPDGQETPMTVLLRAARSSSG
jgi:hypothetical protein